MRKLALLIAAGAFWLFICAVQVLADGGPHVLTMNNGTTGLAGDCASCHRAHTAQAADLLREEVPGLCTNCHNGTKATTDVINGVQYIPTGVAGEYQQGPTNVLGALRGGGFSYALIDSSNAARLSAAGTQVIVISGAPTGGTFTLSFKGQVTNPIAYSASAAVVQTELLALTTIGTSDTYVSSTDGAYMSSETIDNVTVTLSGTTYTVNFQNEFRLAAQPLFVADASGLTGGTSPSIEVADATAIRMASAVGVLASGAPVTSTHGGDGTVWGNGAVDSGAGPDVSLNCANCHNPHGNGQYRILQTTPGSTWSGSTSFEEALQAVEVADVPDPTSVHNYTVLPGVQAQDVVLAGYTADQGDYFRYKYDPSGQANWTNFYLTGDPMNSGWSGSSPTNAAANGGVAPSNSTGLMTAWCITCHTRYSGLEAGPHMPSSLYDTSGGDSLFMYKHGTTRIGCEQCHVSHGSNALMTAAASSTVEWPGGTTGSADSRLLKVDNRGTCNLCHDPTGTVDPGTATGPVPASITPGP